MTAAQYLGTNYGITVAQANEFIMSNLTHLGDVYSVCQQFGVNNDMIAEIVGFGFSGNQVKSFFDANGFNGAALGFNAPEVVTPFTLTSSWIAGRTLYNVYDDGGDGIAESDIMTFNGNGTGFIDGAYGSGTFTYSVDANGVLMMSSSDGSSYIKAIQMENSVDNAIRIEWAESYADAASYTSGEGYEYFGFDSTASLALQALV